MRFILAGIVAAGLFLLLLLGFAGVAGAQSGPGRAPQEFFIEGDRGVVVGLGVNSRLGMIAFKDPNTALGTVVPVPLDKFYTLLREMANAPSRLASIKVFDAEQTLFSTPITIKEGVGGVVRLSLTKVKGDSLSSRPVLTLYAKRGDEKWDNVARFTDNRIHRLASEAALLLPPH